jgi:signal transduction histidine kinase
MDGMNEPTSRRPVARLWPSRAALALDAAVALVIGYLSVIGALFGPPGPLSASRPLNVFLAALGALALLFRRRAPLAVGLVGVVISGAVRVAPLEAMAALATAASRAQDRRQQAATACLALLSAALVTVAFAGRDLVTTLVLIGFLVGLPVGLGFMVGARRSLLAKERGLLAENTRLEERNRIAREMHDVLAHQISLIVLHAGALEVNPHQDRAAIAETAGLIRSLGHQALEELRGILATLRVEPVHEPPLTPQPGLVDLDALFEDSRAAGLDITMDAEGSRVALDQQVERTIFRLVQEGLTNVHRHAAGAPTDVRLRFHERWVEVAVTNAPPPPGPAAGEGASGGRGLRGLRERVELLGGTLTAGPTPERGFKLAARLPLTVDRAAR